jgi:ArsR family transcriptional regulator, arsenate/arsenite/antimonite-responsive transcriptional repressor / arsenate reductase (thioredoxin)
MNTEASVERRVAVHAAMADRTRMRIVDHLSYGDASSSELQAVLGISSNLMAHHLAVLERAGLLGRRRSEADRRRSYLHLLHDALEGLLPQGVTPVPRVVFVCTANSARSQLAAALWARSSAVPVVSAGTHPARKVAAGAVATARRHGLKLAPSGPTPLADVLRRDDFVVTVCDNAHEELDRDQSTLAQVRRLHWSVPDPVPEGTKTAFDAAFGDLHQRVTHLAPRLRAAG